MKNFKGTKEGFKSILFSCLLILTCFFLISASNVYAEDVENKSNDTGDYTLDDTVVTATKTGETKIQETPISITAFDSESMKKRQISDLDGLLRYTPNAQKTPGTHGQIFMRGIGNDFGAFGTESGVGSYLDGVYLERGLGAGDSFLDVERVEVLRGPQGTLWGRNSTGGAINIITKGGTDEFEASVSGEIGSFGLKALEATVSGPLVEDKLTTRISVADREYDGYMTNVVNDQSAGGKDSLSIRGVLEYTPTEKIELKLRANNYTSESTGEGLVYIGAGTNPIANPVAPGFFLSYDGIAAAYDGTGLGRYDFKHDTDEYSDVEDTGYSLHAKIDLSDAFTFTSISAYKHREFSVLYDVDKTDVKTNYPFPPGVVPIDTDYYKQEFDTYSQEFQLHGKIGNFSMLFGLFYYNYEEDMYERIPEGPNVGWAGFTGDVDGIWKTDAYAVFTNVKYQITDDLGIEAGLRYSYEEKTSEGTYISSGAHVIFMPDGTPGWDLKEDWSAITPKVGINYQITDEMMVFGTVSRGFKSGIYWAANMIQDPNASMMMDPEFVWNYEMGLKSDWFDNRLRANVSVFYSDYKDMQVRASKQGVTIYANAGEAEMMGVELELMGRPIPSLPALMFNATAAFMDTEYKEWGDDDLNAGNQMTRAPEKTGSFGVQYTLDYAKYGFVTLRTDVIYSDKVYLSPAQDENQIIEKNTRLNASVRYETENALMSFEFYALNLLDTEKDSFSLGRDIYTAGRGEPRRFGLKLTYNF